MGIELMLHTVIGKVILIYRVGFTGKKFLHHTSIVYECCSILVKITTLAQQIQCNIGQGNVLFKCRPMPGPFAQPLTHDEGVIGEVK
jgi:hypothetical protein